jgi:hypothetical protein
MALANAPGLRESQLRGIESSDLPSHANLLFFCANLAAIEEACLRKRRLAKKSRRTAIGSNPRRASPLPLAS